MTDPLAEIDRLVGALREGTLDAAQGERLSHLLATDPAAVEHYAGHIDVWTALREMGGLPPAELAGPAETRRRPRIQRAPWLFGGAAVAAAVLIGTFVNRTDSPPPGAVSQAAPAAEPPAVVAVLTQVAGAKWGPTPLPTAPGSDLPPGRLVLLEGLAQIEFHCGATVSLEGPADFELIGPDRGFCHAGKLRARMSPHAEGFVVGTPAAEVVDRGTEFSVRVEPAGAAEVHVFDGKVEVRDKTVATGADGARELTVGNGLRIDAAGAARPLTASPGEFIGAAETARRAAEERDARHRRWVEASRRLATDPRLLFYFTFDGQPVWDRTVVNRAAAAGGGRDGGIVGGRWVDGRWPGKGGLLFKAAGDRVRLSVPGEFDRLTLAAWIRVDGFTQMYSSLLMSDGTGPGRTHWSAGSDGKFILGFCQYPGARLDSSSVLGAAQFGQWVHLAAVRDGPAGTLTQYFNGRPVATGPIQTNVRAVIGDAEIGNWSQPPPTSRTPFRPFNGAVDEFAAFSDALSADEISTLYEDGRPY